jgi:hypothetical protein
MPRASSGAVAAARVAHRAARPLRSAVEGSPTSSSAVPCRPAWPQSTMTGRRPRGARPLFDSSAAGASTAGGTAAPSSTAGRAPVLQRTAARSGSSSAWGLTPEMAPRTGWEVRRWLRVRPVGHPRCRYDPATAWCGPTVRRGSRSGTGGTGAEVGFLHFGSRASRQPVKSNAILSPSRMRHAHVSPSRACWIRTIVDRRERPLACFYLQHAFGRPKPSHARSPRRRGD